MLFGGVVRVVAVVRGGYISGVPGSIPARFFVDLGSSSCAGFAGVSPSASRMAALSSLDDRPDPEGGSLSTFDLITFLVYFYIGPSIPFGTSRVYPTGTPTFSFGVFGLLLIGHWPRPRVPV